ncbi:DEAD/DEAH box helicase family protein [Phytoactinopolyspora alkaliphila]|uniref:DEAD/DEAH box helicase family protein n=2 Tax=Phytoactinopolyspora alkaliphila TaxID=1783498 RepID=A0A6N9YNG4_9ACTN|nr:DEAD/DEAH box helicase family protein [Phytoactinopolyspora alkaliphila]
MARPAGLQSKPTPDWTQVRSPRPFRTHQQHALDAIKAAQAAGSRRVWVVLPPGTGKTLVGLEAARRLGQPIVVFGPNTAIQGQWLSEWKTFTPATIRAGTTRDLSALVTALTYQSLATFDPDAEVDEEGHKHQARLGRPRRGSLLDRLHENGRALVTALENAGPITLVLDECHHLLEVWGRLLAELLDDLPNAHVIGLTGTPPETLSSDQAALVDQLFGAPLYSTSIPSVVREGHLAPFAELAWFTTPASSEAQWLAEEAERFAELQTDLLDPARAGTGFLTWLDQRFVTRSVSTAGQADDVPVAGLAPVPPRPETLALEWSRLERDSPGLAAAAMRFHHADLLRLPPGSTMREEHRHRPTAEDWVALLGDYVKGCLLPSPDPRDAALLEEIRAALPSVGYQLTTRGIRRGRSPVDRVLARSEAKTTATVEILAAEADSLGGRLRALVLCDHERATATLPARLRGVLDAQAGSARLVLANLLADPRTTLLEPVLITGRTVAAHALTARKLVAFVAEHAPRLELDDIPSDADGMVEITGRWRSRQWVPLVTRFYETGEARILVGTRALLGEGWDAKGVNTLVDLTTATTPTAVVQTRGRALRVDPTWPEKSANTWTVVCVSDEHPGGTSDWERFVRKHHGYFGVTDSGEIASGVGHVDPGLSPYEPPPVSEFDAMNATMLDRARDRPRVRELWNVGAPYRDELVHTIRVTAGRRSRLDVIEELPRPVPPSTVPGPHGPTRPGWLHTPGPALAVGGTALGVALSIAAAATGIWWLVAVGIVVAIVAWWHRHRRFQAVLLAGGRELAELASGPEPLTFAYAVADALKLAGLSSHGATAVRVGVDRDGSYRIALEGVGTTSSQLFTTALDEVLSPLTAPRYVVPRYISPPVPEDDAALREAGRQWLEETAAPNDVVYHAVPSVLCTNGARVRHFVTAWHTWVSRGEAVRTATPEGEGILVTHRGQDPFSATTRLRVAWS